MDFNSTSTAAVMNSALAGLARNWRRLVTPALVGTVPAAAATFAIFKMTDAGVLVRLAANTPDGFQALPVDLRTQAITDFSLGAAVALALQVLGAVFIFVATHTVAAEGEDFVTTDNDASARALLARVWSVYPRTAVAATVALAGSVAAIGLGLALWSIPFNGVGLPNGLAAGFAMLSLIMVTLPGVWLLASVSLTTAVSSLELTSIIASIQRSASLVRGRVGSTLAYLLIGSLVVLAAVLLQVVAIPLVATSDATTLSLIGMVTAVVGQGVLTTAFGVMISYWYLALGRSLPRR